MNIEITKVHPSAAGFEVDFTCDCGAARARWAGAAPRPGDRRTVEFDADDTLTLGENAAASDVSAPALRAADAMIEVTARVQACFPQEETVSLAFADGRIELAVSEAGRWQVGRWYALRLSALSAFDTNI